MSLYGLLFGKNPNSDRLMEMLELDTTYPIGRYRDIYLNKKGTEIILYTRNGGGNRKCWKEYFTSESNDGNDGNDGSDSDESYKCNCTGCVMTEQIPTHPNYIKDLDDENDCTYAYVYYSVPEKYKEECIQMATGKTPLNVSEKFKEVLDVIKEQQNN